MADVEIAAIDPLSAVDSAAAVLHEAWPRPCFHYTPAYLAWQFQYPSPLRSCAFGAFDGFRLVGFVGACARRVQTRGIAQDIYAYSFAGVLPSFQGRGIASRLYEALFRVIEPTGADIVAFAETGSRAEYVFVKIAQRLRSVVRAHSPLRGYATVVDPVDLATVGTVGTYSDLERLVLESTQQGVGWNSPSRAQLDHHANDPRGAEWLTTEDDGGMAGAIATLFEVANLTDIERVPVLDSVFLPSGRAKHLRNLAISAGSRWSRRSSTVVMLPNPGTIAPSVLREAGFRGTKASFTPYVIGNDPSSPLMSADATNLEIV